MQFNQVLDGPGERLAELARRLESALAERPPGLLVVDVRHNLSGTTELLPPVIAVLEAFESK